MSSSSMTDSSESLNGLTIGHKIYFEDVGTLKSAAGSAEKMKGGSGVGVLGRQHIQQPPRCQVEGCNMDLSDVKAYYSRHKVCVMHSKSAVVIVGGVQKRFCQQCSRFHQLPEFDQEKRSCRRRLANHNERRRKPSRDSLLVSRYGSSSDFDTSNQGGGFLLDFSNNSGITDTYQHARTYEKRSMLQTQSIGNSLTHPWMQSSENPSSDHLLPNAGGETSFPSQEIPPRQYYTGGGGSSDSSCARSLLSNEPWGSTKNQVASYFGGVLHNNLTNLYNSATVNRIQGSSWGFNGNESAGARHTMFSESDLEFCQIPQHVANLYYGDYGEGQQNGRQVIGAEVECRFRESDQQMHW